MVSRFLQLPEIGQGATQAFQISNDADAAIEEATQLELLIDATGESSVDVSDGDAVRYRAYIISAADQNFDLVFPSELTDADLEFHRELVIINQTLYTVTIKTDGTGTTVSCPPGSARMIQFVFEDAIMSGQSGDYFVGTVLGPHSVGTSFNGTPTNNELMFQHVFVEKVIYLDDWLSREAGSIVFSAQPDDTDTVTIDDGVNTPVVFEFESGGGVTGGRTSVTIGIDASTTAGNLRTAINAALLNVLAAGSTTTVTVTNRYGVGGEITATSASPDFVVTDFTGGANGARAFVLTAPTATTTLIIKKNGSNIGTLAFDTDKMTEFLTSGGATTFEPGDVLSVHNQASADATAAGFAITFLGTRAL